MKIGMGQMLVEAGDLEGNLHRAAAFAEEAQQLGCEILVLPECCDLGWANPDDLALAEPVPGKTSEWFRSLAMRCQLYLAAGLTEKDGDRYYNTAVLYSPQGELLLKHRKINVLTGIEDMYSVGDRLGVVDTPVGRIGMSICADNLEESAVIGRVLGRMGCQLLLSPSSWAVDDAFLAEKKRYGQEWKTPYTALADTYGMSIVGVSNVGEVTKGAWKGWHCIGNSISIGPGGTGKELPFGVDQETLAIWDICLQTPEKTGTSLAESAFAAEKKL